MIKKIQNDRLLKAIARQPVDATPIWIMRQAGRYLPEYRQLRQQAGDFLTLCKTPELACQATLQPIQRFPLDAAILFSDILTIPDAMGLGLHFVEGEGPVFQQPIRTAADIAKLQVPDPETDLAYVLQTIHMIQHELAGRIPLIGFCGSPWTIATYMLEGKSNRNFTHTKTMLTDQPTLLHNLLNILANSVISHLAAQISAGVDVVMIFDTWGGMLNTLNYQEFSLGYLGKIVTALKQQHPTIPIILFTKGGAQWLETIADTGCDVIGLDWNINIAAARQRIGSKVALQGNMDPELMHTSPAQIEEGVAKILADYGTGTGHIFNLGHGIHKETPPEHVAVLVDAVHRLSRKYHSQ